MTPLEDNEILGLFWQRSESALAQVQKKYGRMLKHIAARIAGSEAAADECLNDALLALWQNIPPARPENPSAYACKVIRNLAFKRLTYELAQKRSVNASVPLEELEAAVSDAGAEYELERKEVLMIIEDLLDGLSREARAVFLKRYYFMDTVPEIARDLRISEAKVKSILVRSRKKLAEKIRLKGEAL